MSWKKYAGIPIVNNLFTFFSILPVGDQALITDFKKKLKYVYQGAIFGALWSWFFAIFFLSLY